MQINLEKKNECEARLSVVVSAAEAAERRKAILMRYAQSARLPGFRPGKAPASIVAHRFDKEINEQFEDELRSAATDETLAENKELRVIDFGEIRIYDGEDGGYELVSEVTLLPPFELPDYIGLEVKEIPTEVSDEDVDAEIKRYAEGNATYTKTDRALSARNDVAVISFTTTLDGKPVGEVVGRSLGFIAGREEFHLSMSDSFIPGLADGLMGAAAGEERDIETTLPENFLVEELRGKTVVVHCRVKEVQQCNVPEPDEAFITGLIPGSTVEQVRQHVHDALVQRKKKENEVAKADQITNQLAAKLNFDLPESLLERETAATLRRRLPGTVQRTEGDSSSLSDEAMRKQVREETIHSLHVYFALQEIAVREKITVSDREFAEGIARLAASAGERNVRTFYRRLSRANRLRGIRLQMLTEKVLDMLVRRAKVVSE